MTDETNGLTVVRGGESDEPEGTGGVSREVLIETADTVVTRSRVAGGVTTGWHHNGDRHVYGYVVEGRATLEHGPGGKFSADLDAGDFVYVPPRTVRRVVNDSDEDWVIVISFVGSGPPAVSVDGPASGDS